MDILKFISVVLLFCAISFAAEKNTGKDRLPQAVPTAYHDDSKSDGSKQESTEVISESKLPGAVSDSLNTYYHEKKVKKVEKITRNGETRYQIEFKDGNKVTLDKDGRKYYK
jgi:hypothetical protein